MTKSSALRGFFSYYYSFMLGCAKCFPVSGFHNESGHD